MGGMSRRDYTTLVPDDAFLDVDDFDSMPQLAQRLIEINGNESEYNKFFAWKSNYRIDSDPGGMSQRIAEDTHCKLCQALYAQPSEVKPNKSFGDLASWWYESTCRYPIPLW